MNVKLSASQKNKPIYTAEDHAPRLTVGIYAIIQLILMRENKMRRKQEYFGMARVFNKKGFTVWLPAAC
jgi:hypothetical protein